MTDRFSKATPKISQSVPAPDSEDFAQWCEHPVTMWVATQLSNRAKAAKNKFLEISWNGTVPEDKLFKVLIEMKAYEDGLSEFYTATLEDYVSTKDN